MNVELGIVVGLIGNAVTITTFILTTRFMVQENKKGIKLLAKLIDKNYRELSDRIHEIDGRVKIIERRDTEQEKLNMVVQSVINNCPKAIEVKKEIAIKNITGHSNR